MSVANAVAIPNDVVQISPASTAPELTYLADNGFLFRTTPSDALQGVVLGQVAREAGYDRVAIIYINNEYGQGLKDSFTRAFVEPAGKSPAVWLTQQVQLPTAPSCNKLAEGIRRLS